jgi:hypothetical protein
MHPDWTMALKENIVAKPSVYLGAQIKELVTKPQSFGFQSAKTL